ncbi:MAG: HD domain-containing protein [Candidatus Pacearchaeota archaeon]
MRANNNNLERARKALYFQIEKIKDEEIKQFVCSGLSNAPHEFWICPASSSGKYHPCENLGLSGLIRHTIKCVAVSEEFCDFMNFSEIDRDIVIAASILHDIKKGGEPWGEHTHPEHPRIAADYLAKFELREPEKTEIINCVRYHYGNCTRTECDKTRAKNLKPNEMAVHLADVIASRPEISWLPTYKVPEEKINSFFDDYLNNFDWG